MTEPECLGHLRKSSFLGASELSGCFEAQKLQPHEKPKSLRLFDVLQSNGHQRIKGPLHSPAFSLFVKACRSRTKTSARSDKMIAVFPQALGFAVLAL